jgi:hypothetical protein
MKSKVRSMLVSIANCSDKLLFAHPNRACYDRQSKERSKINSALFWASWMLLFLTMVQLWNRFSSGDLDPANLFNSDALFLPSLYKDVFVDKIDWRGWVLPRAPYFFPDMLLYFFLNYLSGSFMSTIVIFSFLQVACLALSFLYLFGMEVDSQTALGAPVIYLFVFVLLSTTHKSWAPVSAPLLLSAHHAGCFIMSITALALLLRRITIQRSHIATSFLLSAITVLCVVSDQMYLIEFTVPAIICLVIIGYFRLIPQRKTFLIIGLLSLSALLGLVIYYLMSLWPEGQSYGGISMNTISVGVSKFGNDLHRLWHSSAPILMFSWLGAALILLIAFEVMLVRIRAGKDRLSDSAKSNLSTYFLILFALICASTVIIVVIFSGNFSDRHHHRYLLSGWLLPLCTAAIILVRAGLQYPHVMRLINGFILVTLTIWLGVSSWCHVDINSPIIPAFYPDSVRCLDEIALRKDLKLGLADYWNARQCTMLSRQKIRVLQVGETGNIRPWINNLKWYLGKFENGPGQLQYSFIIVDRLDEKEIRLKFGPPAEIIACCDIKIWVYGNSLDRIFRATF